MTPQTINLHKHVIERHYNQMTSVFAHWREDSLNDYQTSLHHDFVFWKVENFVKSQKEVESIEKLCQKYFKSIQEIYI